MTTDSNTTTNKLAAEYRPSMTHEVLHSWAADAVKELNALHSSEHSKATQCMNAAIQFALAGDDGLRFLWCWNEGDFDAIRNEWPDAPEDVFLADPLYQGKVANNMVSLVIPDEVIAAAKYAKENCKDDSYYDLEKLTQNQIDTLYQSICEAESDYTSGHFEDFHESLNDAIYASFASTFDEVVKVEAD